MIDTAKHTPGPWALTRDEDHLSFARVIGRPSGGEMIATVWLPRLVSERRKDGESWLAMRERTEPERRACGAEMLANTRLIASAPELLDSIDPDTLDAIADEIDCFEHSARAAGLRSLAKRQRAAIARATGEQS